MKCALFWSGFPTIAPSKIYSTISMFLKKSAEALRESSRTAHWSITRLKRECIDGSPSEMVSRCGGRPRGHSGAYCGRLASVCRFRSIQNCDRCESNPRVSVERAHCPGNRRSGDTRACCFQLSPDLSRRTRSDYVACRDPWKAVAEKLPCMARRVALLHSGTATS